MIDNALQALAVACVLYGSWEAGSLHMRAYAAKLAGSIAQMAVGLVHDVWGVALLGLILTLMQLRGIYIWRKKGVSW